MIQSTEQRILDTVDQLVALGGWATTDEIEKLGNKAKRQIKKALRDERRKQELMAYKVAELSDLIGKLTIR